MSELLSSKTVVQEEEPKVRGIEAASTSVCGAVGVTERGRIGYAELCSSPEEYSQKYGGFTPDSDLALAVKGAFENGISQLWVVRTVHYDDVTDPESATAVKAFGYLTVQGVATPAIIVGTESAPFRLNDGDKIVLSVNGGPDQEAMFAGRSAKVNSAPTHGPYPLTDGDTLTLNFEDGREQTVLFESDDFDNIGVATSEEVAAVINAQIDGGKATVVPAS